jgi:predicted RNA binding protein YcfA (HicA-like mRNA interferase family)
MPISGKNFCKLLEKQGWIHHRTTGSHYIYKKVGTKQIISVPVHKNKDLPPGTLKSLMKAAEIDKLSEP